KSQRCIERTSPGLRSAATANCRTDLCREPIIEQSGGRRLERNSLEADVAGAAAVRYGIRIPGRGGGQLPADPARAGTATVLSGKISGRVVSAANAGADACIGFGA